MENPTRDITPIIHLLTQSPPSLQLETLHRYFTPDASFTHPFCRTPSFDVELYGYNFNSRWLIGYLYRWYKIMSPKIELSVDSVAYDANAHILYVKIHQVFAIWAIPFYRAPVNLVSVLQLVPQRSSGPSDEATAGQLNGDGNDTAIDNGNNNGDGRPLRYLIASQNDLYQTDEFFKFFSLFRIAWLGLLLWQYVATLVSVLLAGVGSPISWAEEQWYIGGKDEKIKKIL